MAKAKTPTEEKFTDIDFNLFEAIAALDKKDYGYYDRLTEDQQKKFSPFMLIKYISALKGKTELQQFHVLSTNEFANRYLFNENIQKHPKLQWYMLCAASLGAGKQYHPWIPQIKESVGKLKDRASVKDIKEYFSKTYPNTDDETLSEISKMFVDQQHKKVYLAEKYPELKLDDINVLCEFVTEQDIEQYEKDSGN